VFKTEILVPRLVFFAKYPTSACNIRIITLSIFLLMLGFVVGGIAYLIDPDSYADWSFYTPGRASQVRQVEG